jgi:hypothetical protein
MRSCQLQPMRSPYYGELRVPSQRDLPGDNTPGNFSRAIRCGGNLPPLPARKTPCGELSYLFSIASSSSESLVAGPYPPPIASQRCLKVGSVVSCGGSSLAEPTELYPKPDLLSANPMLPQRTNRWDMRIAHKKTWRLRQGRERTDLFVVRARSLDPGTASDPLPSCTTIDPRVVGKKPCPSQKPQPVSPPLRATIAAVGSAARSTDCPGQVSTATAVRELRTHPSLSPLV